MEFVYFILAHKNPFQLQELVNALQDGDNYFFIYIDKKSELSLFTQGNYSLPERVFFCRDRGAVAWGGFSQIEATMRLARMMKEQKITPAYVHLISGQDFPLKPNGEIKAFFEKHIGDNFLSYHAMPYKNWSGNGGMDRFTYKWLIDDSGYSRASTLVEIQKERKMCRIYPEGFKPYGGSQWWSLTYDCIDLLSQTCVAGDPLYEFYRYTLLPDEMYFHTVLLNSEFKKRIVNNNLRYIDWVNGPEYPRTFRMADLHKLRSTDCLYARKFDDAVDLEIRQLMKVRTMELK